MARTRDWAMPRLSRAISVRALLFAVQDPPTDVDHDRGRCDRTENQVQR
jgi:hypothetical protein